MGYRWNKNTIENKTLVQSREFDQAHNTYVSLINGGIDRENLPEECINQTSLRAHSFGKAQITEKIATPESQTSQDSNYGAPFSNQNTRGNRIVGMKYGSLPINEGDAFFPITSHDIECQEGMLKIHWKCNAYIPMYWAYYKNFTTTRVQRKRYQWKIQVNGITVYDSAAICQPFFTTNIALNIPISKGTQKVEVLLRLPAKLEDDDNTVQLQYWGGNLYTHNIYR